MNQLREPWIERQLMALPNSNSPFDSFIIGTFQNPASDKILRRRVGPELNDPFADHSSPQPIQLFNGSGIQIDVAIECRGLSLSTSGGRLVFSRRDGRIVRLPFKNTRIVRGFRG
jgi:hypothetical protein